MTPARGVSGPLAAAVLALIGVLAVPSRPAAGPQSVGSLTSEARSELERMNEFARLESQSRQLLKERRFAEARSVALRALELNVSNRRGKILLGDIDAAEKAAAPAPAAGRDEGAPTAPRTPAPRVPAPATREPRAPAARGTADAGARGSQVVREVIHAYLAGDYAGALSASAAAGDTAPPRVWLYAACSEAALGLLDARTADERFARARQLYARAQASGLSFTADRQVISPRIWDVLATP